MSRVLFKINELKRLYVECSNPAKELIVLNAINDIKALNNLPRVE